MPNPLRAVWGKLVKYFRFFVLISISYCKDDIEKYLIYFSIAWKTNKACKFSDAFGHYLFYAAAVQFVCVPIISWITDATAKRSRTVLIASLTLELAFELTLWVIPSMPVWLVVVLQLARGVAHTQNYNSIWKLFKQRVQHLPTSHQNSVFMSVGMCGLSGESLIDLLVFTGLFTMTNRAWTHPSFEAVATYVYAATIGLSALAILVAFLLSDDYLYPSEDQLLLNSSSQVEKEENSNSIPLSHSQDIEHAKETNPLGNSHSAGNPETEGVLKYFINGLVSIFRHPLTASVTAHAVLLYLIYSLTINAITLDVASSSSSGVLPTLDNLCNDDFKNLTVNSMFSFVMYLIVSILFAALVPYIPPIAFYRWVYPIFGTLFLGCFIPLFMSLAASSSSTPTIHIPTLVNDIAAAVLAVLPWFFYRYDMLLATANTPVQYLGLLVGIIGYIRYLTPALPGLLLLYDLKLASLIIGASLLVSSLVLCVMFVIMFPHILKTASFSV